MNRLRKRHHQTPLATVSTRVDAAVKKRAAEVLALSGLSISDAVRLLLARTAEDGQLPFYTLIPNATTRAAMREARTLKGRGVDSVAALMADLHSDD